MTIHAHIICWNRADVIHLTIGHYKKFCDKIFIYDNFSDDKTREIAESLGCEVNLFGFAGVLDDHQYRELKNSAWKGSSADWVIIVDDDEILYNEDLRFILNQGRINGATIFKPQGYSMHSDKLPENNWTDISTGWKDDNYSKLCVFNPEAIREIGYEYGCHTHQKDCPKGRLVYGLDQLYLLHYCFVGGVDRIIKRWGEYEPRRQKSLINLRWNLGHRYSKKESEIRKEWGESFEKSSKLEFIPL